jgi:hypothetical protein
MQNFGFGDRYYVYTLTGGTDNGEFSRKAFVNGQGPALASGGPDNFESIKAKGMLIGDGVKITAPARSVSYVLIENGENVITGIESMNTWNVRVFPNPAADSFTVEFPPHVFTSLEIMDIHGKKIASTTIERDQSSVNVSTSRKQSVYVVKLFNGKQSVVKKVVVP